MSSQTLDWSLLPPTYKTPMVFSLPLSKRFGAPIYCKLENLQPSGSFKDRGISLLCSHLVQKGALELVSASGGNAGLAAAYAGLRLGVRVRVLAFEGITDLAMERIESLGAQVVRAGETWSEVHQHALKLSRKSGRAYVPPFDHPIIWQGYSSMVSELAEECGKPGAIVLSVGGGGLLSGIARGMREQSWLDVPIVAAETDGAHSFNLSLKAGKNITMDRIDSIAITLGATRVADEALRVASSFEVHSHVVSDAQAVSACLSFLGEHRMLVEPACGAALASIQHAVELRREDDSPVFVIVCGGSGADIDSLQSFS